MRTPLTTLAGWILLSGAALAQNGADECDSADVAAPGPGSLAFDTSNCSDTGMAATNGVLTQCPTISDDVWYLWTATDTGQHTFSTCGAATFDTEIAVWLNPDGDGDCDNLMPMGCNDDGAGCAGFTSELSLPIVMGAEYFIQIGDSNLTGGDHHGQGTLTITLDTPPPTNDDCSTPETVVGLGNFPYDTTGATSSGFTGGGACGAGLNQDVFFTWTAPMAGDYRVETCLTSYDTRLSVYAGADCNATCVMSNDDACGLQSAIDLVGLAGGEVFLIQAGGFGAEAGPGILTIGGLVPMGADCTDPIDLGSAPGMFAYDTTGATSSGFNPIGCIFVNQDMFFTWTAPATKAYIFNTCFTSYDTRIAVHDGADCGAACLAGNDDACGAQSSVVVPLTVGQVVLVQVGGAGAEAGAGNLSILEYVDPCDITPDDALEENDDCATAVVLPPGKWSDLFVHQMDEDWYVVTVPPLTTAYMQAIFLDDMGDVDLHLFDVCGGSLVDQSITRTDNEQVAFSNMTQSPVDVLLQVDMFDRDDHLCNDYELLVSIEAGMPGQTYCPATPNSTGLIAQITGSGSSSVTSNDLVLIANPVPSNVTGLFINSGTQAQIPFGNKIRCVADPFFRSRVFRAQGSVLAIPIDNNVVPGIHQGASRFFQAWFRDNADTDFFGLSNGYAIVFTE